MSTTEEAQSATPVGGSPAVVYTHRQIMLVMSGLMMGLLLAGWIGDCKDAKTQLKRDIVCRAQHLTKS